MNVRLGEPVSQGLTRSALPTHSSASATFELSPPSLPSPQYGGHRLAGSQAPGAKTPLFPNPAQQWSVRPVSQDGLWAERGGFQLLLLAELGPLGQVSTSVVTHRRPPQGPTTVLQGPARMAPGLPSSPGRTTAPLKLLVEQLQSGLLIIALVQ